MGDPCADRKGGVGAVVHTSVAMLYSNLVTRPTGEAVRVAIEGRIGGVEGTTLSILDFSRIGVIDFSCADEVVAKLLKKYAGDDRPAEAYFVACGVDEHHREPIESVLERYRLLLVTIEDERPQLWGPVPSRLRHAWHRLNEMGETVSEEFASAHGIERDTATSWLRRMVSQRVALSQDGEHFSSLPAILSRDQAPYLTSAEGEPPRAAAEEAGPYGSERRLHTLEEDGLDVGLPEGEGDGFFSLI